MGSLNSKANNIKMPLCLFEKIKKHNKTFAELTNSYGRRPTDLEMVEAMGLESIKDLYEIEKIKYIMETISMNTLVGDDDEAEFQDFIIDGNYNVEDEVMEEDMMEKVNYFIDDIELSLSEEFDERNKDIVRMRYGIGYDKCYTTIEVGKKYNITPERVRKIQETALRRYRFYARFKKYGLNDYIELEGGKNYAL